MKPKRPFNKDDGKGGFKAIDPVKDQPCEMTRCRTNKKGGCLKIFNNGVKPAGFGTAQCPGAIWIPETELHPDKCRVVHLEHRNREPVKVTRGSRLASSTQSHIKGEAMDETNKMKEPETVKYLVTDRMRVESLERIRDNNYAGALFSFFGSLGMCLLATIFTLAPGLYNGPMVGGAAELARTFMIMAALFLFLGGLAVLAGYQTDKRMRKGFKYVRREYLENLEDIE